MRTISILEDDDVIQKTDWVRPLHFDGPANTRSIYSGMPENNTRWVRVREYFGPWMFGMTVGEYHQHLEDKCVYGVNKAMRFEFVRGDMPEKHVW